MWRVDIAFLAAAASAVASPCAESDASIADNREAVCASIVGPGTDWCPYSPNATTKVKHDWPSQATYVHALVGGLSATPLPCLATPLAVDTVDWLNTVQSDKNRSGSVLQTWAVGQVAYYDMPYPPTAPRVESPGTLGRKCWAMAYLAQTWDERGVEASLARANLSLANWSRAYDAAVELTMRLCVEVMANCFVNASYDPSRNGTCPMKVVEFEGGFERENAQRRNIVHYPFPRA